MNISVQNKLCIDKRPLSLIIVMFYFIIMFISNVDSFILFAEEVKSEWVIAVAEFKFENSKPMYASYSKIVPRMFLTYLEGKGKHIETMSEQKMRSLMKVSSKKLKLIREREQLIKDKDNLFFSIESHKSKQARLEKIEKQISDKEAELEKAELEIKIQDNKFYDEKKLKNVVLWREGKDLYNYDETRDLGFALQKDGISAILRGSLRDASGYLIIKVQFETGLKGVKVHEFVEAGRYSDAEELVRRISSQIYSVIQSTKEIKVFFDVSPQDAKVYIDGNIVSDFSKPMFLHEGEYTVEASAEEHVSSTKVVLLKDKKYYKLKVKLKRENHALLAFNIDGKPDLFFKTRYYGTGATQLKLPYQTTVVEFENGKTHTYVLLDKEKIPISEFPQNMVVKLNQKETKKLIETQRKVMYWSLAAFYAVLPAYLIVDSVYNDKKQSFADGRLEQTAKNAQNIKDLGTASVTMQSFAIVAGINYFIQLVVYLVFSDRAIPRVPRMSTLDVPVHDISELDADSVDVDHSESPPNNEGLESSNIPSIQK